MVLVRSGSTAETGELILRQLLKIAIVMERRRTAAMASGVRIETSSKPSGRRSVQHGLERR
jgi:hypothetical protein